MDLENFSSAELEVSYYISTGELNFVGTASSLSEEQQSSFLKQIRYEEYVNNGLTKKRKYMSGEEEKLCFKVMSYNILSQQLLDQHRYLYRNQTRSILRWEYRLPRILSEIRMEDPDILCLQEVQESHLESFSSKLEQMGYAGVFKKKTGGKVDGCAIYYRSCMFDLNIKRTVEYFQPWASRLLNRDNVGLILRLRVGSEHIVVATTHLLYNPRRHDVRLAQIQLFLAEVHQLANIGGKKVGIILTGDLNSKPDSSVVHLITEGTLVHDYPPSPGKLPYQTFTPQLHSSERGSPASSSSSERNSFDNSESPTKYPIVKSNSTVSNKFKFHSVYSFSEGNDSVVTTYQNEWVSVDYVFYSCCENLELISRVRLPVIKECESFIKELPNYVSPSDHLPLIATFAIKV